MNYEKLIYTGESLISGVQSNIHKTNLFSLNGSQVFFVEAPATGQFSALVSLNSQTLIEGEMVKVSLPFIDIFSTSGDYYIDESLYEKEAFFDSSFALSDLPSVEILYDYRPKQKPAIFESQNTGSFSTGIFHEIAISMPSYTGRLSSLDFFLNGQKIYSGDSYLITGSNNGFSYLMPVTGKLACLPKNSGFLSIIDSFADVYGYKFVEKCSNVYLNGLEQSPKSWMELSTGVKLIETGLLPSVNFSSSQNTYASL